TPPLNIYIVKCLLQSSFVYDSVVTCTIFSPRFRNKLEYAGRFKILRLYSRQTLVYHLGSSLNTRFQFVWEYPKINYTLLCSLILQLPLRRKRSAEHKHLTAVHKNKLVAP